MAMNRQEKQVVIDSLSNDFKTSEAAFLVSLKGLTVNQLQELRKNLREKGGKLRLAKNTLTKRAAHELEAVCALEPYLKNQVGIVFAKGDSPAVANVLWTISQSNEKFSLVVGCFESKLIDKDMIKFLATLPPRPVLLAQVCGTIKAPLVGHVSLLHQMLARLLWVLESAAKKRQA